MKKSSIVIYAVLLVSLAGLTRSVVKNGWAGTFKPSDAITLPIMAGIGFLLSRYGSRE